LTASLCIGAQIWIATDDGRKQYNEATARTGYAASSHPRVPFGLGASRMIREIEIRWPSGAKQLLHDVAADRVVAVRVRYEIRLSYGAYLGRMV
jgi:hypothetical protein